MHALRNLLPVLVALLPALTAPPATAGVELAGAIHEQSGYSDGRAGTTPRDFFGNGRDRGLDFVAGTDHDAVLRAPFSVGSGCASVEGLASCVLADDDNPADALRKWDATAEHAAEFTTPSFSAIRGFEYSSRAQGHINVLGSANFTDWITGGSEALGMQPFWDWFTSAPARGGGDDGIAIFNHPGYEKTAMYEDFRLAPAAVPRVVGLEVFGFRSADYGSTGGPSGGPYALALDRGWRVGAIGAEDQHDPAKVALGRQAKTIVDAERNAPGAILDALRARRFYAVLDAWRRIRFSVARQGMGSTVRSAAGRKLAIRATTNDPDAVVEIVTSGGRVVTAGLGSARISRRASGGERWYYARIRSGNDHTPVAYSTPVWVTAVPMHPRHSH